MRIARSSTPDILVLKESTLFLMFLSLLFASMGVGFLRMAADENMWVRTFSGYSRAGLGSQLAWIAFAVVLLPAAAFIAGQRSAVVIDRKARCVVERLGLFLTWKRRARPFAELEYVLLTPEEYGASLSIHGARFIIPIDCGRRVDLAPLAQRIVDASGLPLVSKLPQQKNT